MANDVIQRLAETTSPDQWESLGGTARQYRLKDNPDITISRRHFDEWVGRAKGTTLERQGAERKAARFNEPPKNMGKGWLSKEFPNSAELEEYRVNSIAPRSDVWIVAYGTPFLYGGAVGWYTVIAKTMNKYVEYEEILDGAENMFAKIQRWGLRWTSPRV